MSDVEAGLWGLIVAASLVLGAVIGVIRRPPRIPLGLVMGFGSGVLLSAVAFELVTDAVETSGETSGELSSTIIGLFAGTAVFSIGDLLIGRMGCRHRKNIAGAPPEGAGLTIVLGALLDGIPESAVLGLTLLQTGNIGGAMLVAVFVSNLPEGIAATVSLRNAGWTMSAFAGGAILTMLATSMMAARLHRWRPQGADRREHAQTGLQIPHSMNSHTSNHHRKETMMTSTRRSTVTTPSAPTVTPR